ncbi:MAG: DUF5711 family protein [Oscillospiraceae bacterium]|nr:DUF5711 family protein [Oscillospiraceae bacterium]
MAVTDVSELRKRREKKRTRNMLIKAFVVILICGIAVVTVVTRNSWLPAFQGILSRIPAATDQDYSQTDTVSGSFLISIDGGSDYQMRAMGDCIALLDDSKFHVYSATGSVMYETQHTYANPILAVNSSKALVYDLGGTDFSLEGKYKNVYEKTANNVILRAELSSKDYVAVVTKSENLLSMLKVYDGKGTEVFRYSSYDGRIIDVAFNSDSSGCVLTVIGAQDGELISQMIRFDFSDTSVQWESEPISAIALDVIFTQDGSVMLIGDTMSALYTADGILQASYTYSDTIVDYSTEDDLAAVITTNTAKRKTEMILITPENITNPIVIELDYNTEKVYCEGGQAHILNDEGVCTYDSAGQPVASASLEDDYEDICRIKGYLYLLGYDSVSCMDYAS